MPGHVVRRASSLAGKNNGTTGPAEPAETPVSETASTTETAPEKPKRRRRAPASKGSAAAKSRKKAEAPKITDEDLLCVGEVVKIAFNGGEDPVEPADLVATWRARVAAWDKVHGGG